MSCQNTSLGQNWFPCCLVNVFGSQVFFSETNVNFASDCEHLGVQHGIVEEKDAGVEGMMMRMMMRKVMMMMMRRNP